MSHPVSELDFGTLSHLPQLDGIIQAAKGCQRTALASGAITASLCFEREKRWLLSE